MTNFRDSKEEEHLSIKDVSKTHKVKIFTNQLKQLEKYNWHNEVKNK